MKRRRVALVRVLLAALVVSSGCSGLLSGGGSPGGSPTPAPVPDHESPPGLSRTGVTNPAALVEAHTARLSTRSYTRVVNETVVHRNGTVAAHFRLTARVGADRRRVHIVVRSLRNGTTDPERRR